MKLTARERCLTVLVVAAVLCLAYYRVVLAPAQRQIAECEHAIEQATTLLNGYQQLFSRKQDLLSRHKLVASPSDLERPYGSVIDLMSDLQTLAEDILEFSTLRPVGIGGTGHGHKRFAVECDLNADLKRITTLLYRIEKQRSMLSVSRLSLSKTTTEGGLLRARFVVESAGL